MIWFMTPAWLAAFNNCGWIAANPAAFPPIAFTAEPIISFMAWMLFKLNCCSPTERLFLLASVESGIEFRLYNALSSGLILPLRLPILLRPSEVIRPPNRLFNVNVLLGCCGWGWAWRYWLTKVWNGWAVGRIEDVCWKCSCGCFLLSLLFMLNCFDLFWTLRTIGCCCCCCNSTLLLCTDRTGTSEVNNNVDDGENFLCCCDVKLGSVCFCCCSTFPRLDSWDDDDDEGETKEDSCCWACNLGRDCSCWLVALCNNITEIKAII